MRFMTDKRGAVALITRGAAGTPYQRFRSYDTMADKLSSPPNTTLVDLGRLAKQLSRRRKQQLVLVLVLMFAGAFAELATLGAALPFLAVVATSQKALFEPVTSRRLFKSWMETGQLGKYMPVTVLFSIVGCGCHLFGWH